MTQIKQTLEQFQVTRDGEVDPYYQRRQRVEAIVGHTARLGSHIAAKVGHIATETFTPLKLEVFDATHGTTLREEYFSKKHHLAEVALRQEVGL